jgi:hypothetical protein
MGLSRWQRQPNLGRTNMPMMAVRPRMPAGHFIPLATSRYEAAAPIMMAVMTQVVLMIHLFIISSVLLSLRTGPF